MSATYIKEQLANNITGLELVAGEVCVCVGEGGGRRGGRGSAIWASDIAMSTCQECQSGDPRDYTMIP